MGTEAMGDRMREYTGFCDEQDIQNQVRNEVVGNGGTLDYEAIARRLTEKFSKQLGYEFSSENIQGKEAATIIKEITEAIIANTKKNIRCTCEH